MRQNLTCDYKISIMSKKRSKKKEREEDAEWINVHNWMLLFTARRDRLFRLRDVDFRTHFHIHQHVFLSLLRTPRRCEAREGKNHLQGEWCVKKKKWKVVQCPSAVHESMGGFATSLALSHTQWARENEEPRGLAKIESFYNFFLGFTTWILTSMRGCWVTCKFLFEK